MMGSQRGGDLILLAKRNPVCMEDMFGAGVSLP